MNVERYFLVQCVCPGPLSHEVTESKFSVRSSPHSFPYSFPRQLGDHWQFQSFTGTWRLVSTFTDFVNSPGFFSWWVTDPLSSNTNLDTSWTLYYRSRFMYLSSVLCCFSLFILTESQHRCDPEWDLVQIHFFIHFLTIHPPWDLGQIHFLIYFLRHRPTLSRKNKEVNLDKILDFDFIVQSYFPVQCMSLLVPYHVLLPSQTTDVIHCGIFESPD